MPPRRKHHRSRREEPEEQPERNEQVAQFPAPTPTGEPATPLFADQVAVKFARIERAITRDALTFYVTTLKKKKKALEEMGLSTEGIDERVSIINGGNGLGSGIYSRLTEQMSIGDQAQLQLDDERKAQEAEAIATRDILLKLDDMPPGEIADKLLAYVRTWSSEQRRAAIEYATTVNAIPEGEKFTGEVPKFVRWAIDRAIEWTMPEDEIKHWLAKGPYRATWWTDDSNKTWWYASVPPKTVTEAEEQTDEAIAAQEKRTPLTDAVVEHGLFETEVEAQRCAARLNRIIGIEQQLGGTAES